MFYFNTIKDFVTNCFYPQLPGQEAQKIPEEQRTFEQFTQLPNELIVHIARQLPPRELVYLLGESKQIRNVTNDVFHGNDALVENFLQECQTNLYALPNLVKTAIRDVLHTLRHQSIQTIKTFRDSVLKNYLNSTYDTYTQNPNTSVLGSLNRVSLSLYVRKMVSNVFVLFPQTTISKDTNLGTLLGAFKLNFDEMPEELRLQLKEIGKESTRLDFGMALISEMIFERDFDIFAYAENQEALLYLLDRISKINEYFPNLEFLGIPFFIVKGSEDANLLAPLKELKNLKRVVTNARYGIRDNNLVQQSLLEVLPGVNFS